MLPGMTSPLAGRRNGAMIDVIRRLGLTTNLKLCLDAGDISSYSSGQKWLDRSGNGYDFYRGSGSGSDSADPTFNGTAGGNSASEFWSSDGGDYFTYDTTNETWMDNLHKNNAVFSLTAWVYGQPTGTAINIMGTSGSDLSNVGINVSMRLNGNTTPLVVIANGSGTSALNLNFAHGSSLASRWNFFGIAVNEAAGVSALRINDVTDAPAATYSSPSAASATGAMQIMSRGNGSEPGESGTRFNTFAMWEGTALTAANLAAIYASTRSKFGV